MKKQIVAIVTDKPLKIADDDLVIAADPKGQYIAIYNHYDMHYIFPKNMKIVLKNTRHFVNKIFDKI